MIEAQVEIKHATRRISRHSWVNTVAETGDQRVRILCPTVSGFEVTFSYSDGLFLHIRECSVLRVRVSQSCLQGSPGSVKDSVSPPGLISAANRLVSVISKHSLKNIIDKARSTKNNKGSGKIQCVCCKWKPLSTGTF